MNPAGAHATLGPARLGSGSAPADDQPRRRDACGSIGNVFYLLVNLCVTALGLMVVAHLISGFRIDSFGAALLAALVIGLVNATLGLLLKIVTFPLTIITFGLFLLVINALMLRLASSMVPGFEVSGFWPALLGAIILALINTVMRHLVFK
jgi:putative membrane protein